MAVNETLAVVSDDLFKGAVVVYAIGMVAFTAEWAFGQRGRVAASAYPSAESVPELSVDVVPVSGSETRKPVAVAVRKAAPPPSRAGQPRGSAGDRLGRAAVLITVAGAVVHAASVVTRGWSVDRVPWGNMYEFSSVVALLAVTAFLGALVKAPTIRYLGGFVMFPVLVVMFLAGTVLYARAQTLVPALQSYWLAIHVSAIAMGEGLLMTSAVITTMYLLRSRWDRRVAATELTDSPTRWTPVSRLGGHLPPAATLDRVAYRIVAIAFPLYTFAVIAGAIWAEAAWGRYWGWDPKEVWAFIAWVVYAAYLHARATAGWRGRTAAWINLVGFAAMTFNFFVVNTVIAGLHSYAGLN